MLSRQAENTVACVGQSESAGSEQSHSVVRSARGQFDASMLRAWSFLFSQVKTVLTQPSNHLFQ